MERRDKCIRLKMQGKDENGNHVFYVPVKEIQKWAKEPENAQISEDEEPKEVVDSFETFDR